MESSASMEERTFRLLAEGRPLRQVRAGDVIFRSGDLGDCLYFVVEGAIVLVWEPGGLSETLGPGCSFGVGALVDPEHRRMGTATALSEGQLLVMNREQFLLAVQELPMFALEMLHDLDQRLRQLKSRLRAPRGAEATP